MSGPTLPADFAEAFTVPSTGAVEISAYRVREGPASGPALIWGHANGFNAGCYHPFLRRLSTHFQIFAYDARGHGASGCPTGNIADDYAMPRFAEDLRAVTAQARDRIGGAVPLHFASHSLGGLAAVLLEAALAEAPFDSLTLFEPPIYPPDDHEEREAALRHSPNFVRWAAGRRDHFPDHRSLHAEVEKIIAYRRFDDDMMAAYLAAAVEAAPGGGLVLRCPSQIESAIYANCPDSGIFEQTAKVATRTRIYATDQTVLQQHSWAPGTMAAIAANMPSAQARTMPGCLHLMVQEDPGACAAAVIDHALG